ncbi:prephenate dehydrogenase/arogenate dehydrogenase family protein [Candidatus Peregrinibacteria bacterium]|nr:prephenate dehydrogenase/arogenate dehydrogenase family protein [Candidatus Peregrinibacteria bacterium]
MISKTHKNVGIIGGTHGTGAQFATLLKQQGFHVRVSGRKTKIVNEQLAKESDILIFAPPLTHSVEIIGKTIPHCRKKDQWVLDVCSLKTRQVNAMKKAAGHVVGMHPLFGSNFTNVQGQDIILCPVSKTHLPDVTRLLETLGLNVHIMTPHKYDRLMATVQVIPHLNALISGSLFRALGIHPEDSLKICSPVYKTELYMIGRIYAQNPELYSAILAQNPLSKKVAQKLTSIVTNLAIEIAHGNADLLTKTFKLNQKHFGAFAQKALTQSQKIFKNM